MDLERRTIAAHTVIWLACAVVAGAMGCGSDALVPDLVDSGNNDADVCACQPAETLRAEQLSRALEELPLSRSSESSLFGVACTEGNRAIGGGCMHQPSHSSVQVMTTGLYLDAPEDRWQCQMSNLTPIDRTMQLHVVCVAPGNDQQQPIGCACPPAEPLFDRIVRTTSTVALAGYDSAILGATCERDAVLVGGGCVAGQTLSFAHSVTVTRTGIEPTLPSTWMCGWRNSADIYGTVEATAICITPPSPGTAPEAEPLAERVSYVTETRTLPTNNSLNNTVACAAGDTLLQGGCIVDREDPQSDLVTLFQQGFDDTNPNAWRCGWNNPTDTTPTATATAICLKPPSAR